jgi:hypothetical protein
MWITLLFALLFALLAITFVVWPLWRAPQMALVDEDSVLSELIQRKDVALASIREIEFDHQTGKLNADDFQRINSRLRQQAIVFLRQIEKTAPATSGLEAELEAAIRNQRAVGDRVTSAAVTAAVTMVAPATTPVVANGTSTVMSTATNFCPQCGTRIAANANFCANCGAALQRVKDEG